MKKERTLEEMRAMSEQEPPTVPELTIDEYLADLQAIVFTFGKVTRVLDKLVHAVESADARVKESALKDTKQSIAGLVESVMTLGDHLRIGRWMSQMSDAEREILAARLGLDEEPEGDDS